MLHKIGNKRDATVEISRFEVFCLDRFVRNALSFASIFIFRTRQNEGKAVFDRSGRSKKSKPANIITRYIFERIFSSTEIELFFTMNRICLR